MRGRVLVLALVASGCGAGRSVQPASDAPSPQPDGSQGCQATIAYMPVMPTAPTTIRATAYVDAPGVPQLTWSVSIAGTSVVPTDTASDGSYIDFFADQPGVYDVAVDVTGVACQSAGIPIPVMASNGNLADFRLRVWPSPDLAPTQESVIEVHGGGDTFHAVTLDPGVMLAGTVRNGATGVPAYLRFMPVATPDAYVETFSAADGTFSLRLLGQPHQVLIVPAVPGLAPTLASWALGTTTLAVGPGTTVTGHVLDSAGAGLGGATVQLASGGVPSSLATTAGDGSFTLHAAFAAGATVAVSVVPPPGRGLPRLAASGVLDLAQPLQIRYAALSTCDLAGTPVTRAGVHQAGAHVTLVGTLAASAGTITEGVAATATGTVSIAATADATGVLPSTLAPRVPLTAVVQIAPGDLATSALDLTAGPPVAVAAPAPITATGSVVGPNQAVLAGVHVQASPAGALAAAGASAIETVSAADGSYQLVLASGGTYDLRFVDPEGRAAPLVVTGATPQSVPPTAALATALQLSGTVAVSGSSNQVIGAAVQLLCATCTGLDAARPIAETATGATSGFRVAVPDPGTM